MVGISGGSWMNTFQPKIFPLKLSISIPFNWILKVHGWKDRRSASGRFSSENIPFKIKKYYRAYNVTIYVMYWYTRLDGNVAYLRNNGNMPINVLFIIWRGAFKTCFFLHFVTDQSQLFSTKWKVCDGNFLPHSPPPLEALRQDPFIGHFYRPRRFKQHFHQAFPSRLKFH